MWIFRILYRAKIGRLGKLGKFPPSKPIRKSRIERDFISMYGNWWTLQFWIFWQFFPFFPLKHGYLCAKCWRFFTREWHAWRQSILSLFEVPSLKEGQTTENYLLTYSALCSLHQPSFLWGGTWGESLSTTCQELPGTCEPGKNPRKNEGPQRLFMWCRGWTPTLCFWSIMKSDNFNLKPTWISHIWLHS